MTAYKNAIKRMKPTPKYIKEIARAAGYDTAEFEGSWQDYRVYSGRMFGADDEDNPPKIGKPLIILQEGRGKARVAADEEARAFLQAVAAREDALEEFRSLLQLLEYVTADDEDKRSRILQDINSGAVELYAYYPGQEDAPEPAPGAEYLGGIIDGSLYLQPRTFKPSGSHESPALIAAKEGK